jgi:hypothetical protein
MLEPMRSVFRPLTVSIALTALAGGIAAADANRPPPTALPASTPAPDSDAAKHAKRTVCLKDAKSKKLVGAPKAAFIKECMAAP